MPNGYVGTTEVCGLPCARFGRVLMSRPDISRLLQVKPTTEWWPRASWRRG